MAAEGGDITTTTVEPLEPAADADARHARVPQPRAVAPVLRGFLGLECVHHAPRAMMLRKGGYWAIVCLEAGDAACGRCSVGNHWGIDMERAPMSSRAHALALEHKDRYGIAEDRPRSPTITARSASTCMDRDGNWWEFQYAGEGRAAAMAAMTSTSRAATSRTCRAAARATASSETP